jgi:hypothetical protein
MEEVICKKTQLSSYILKQLQKKIGIIKRNRGGIKLE